MPFKQNQIRNSTPLSLIFDVIKIESRNIKHLYVYATFVGVTSLALPLGIQTIIGYAMNGHLINSWFFQYSIITTIFLLVGIGYNDKNKWYRFISMHNVKIWSILMNDCKVNLSTHAICGLARK